MRSEIECQSFPPLFVDIHSNMYPQIRPGAFGAASRELPAVCRRIGIQHREGTVGMFLSRLGNY